VDIGTVGLGGETSSAWERRKGNDALERPISEPLYFPQADPPGRASCYRRQT
jgi:hypothetical protein